MSYHKERQLIEDTFVLAFCHGLQTELPDDAVMESFVEFVVARQKYDQSLDEKFEFNESFIYSCLHKFINRLHLNGGKEW